MSVMLKFSNTANADAESRRGGDTEKVTSPHLRVAASPRLLLLLLAACCLLPTAACRQDMQVQPKYIAYRESTFFRDGSSSRSPVAGTVPRGYLRDDTVLYSGKKPKTMGAQTAQTTGGQTIGGQQTRPPAEQATPGAPINPAAMYPDDADSFPFPVTMEVLNRGQERFQIFCSVCHGMTGYGDGIVARRGFNQPRPASFHQDRLRQAPVGHFFDVVTNGWGAMPSYASQVPVNDRWVVIAYIRALQLSQMPPSSRPAPGSSTMSALPGEKK